MTAASMESWERFDGSMEYYALVNPHDVVVGSRGQSAFTDNAGSCTHEEFLAGMFHDVIRRSLGEAVLQAMIADVRGR
jgi:hypothetical protein